MVESVNLEVREIPLDLLEEVSKLSPPNNPVSPPMSTGDTNEPANMSAANTGKVTNPTINTVNLNDLQDMGLRFKEPLGGSLVMDDMSQLQHQLQLQTAAAKVSHPSAVFLQPENIEHQPDVGSTNVERSNQAGQLQLQLELRDLIASGFDPPSLQSSIDMNFEPQEGRPGGRVKVNLSSNPRPESEAANVRLRPNQTPERTE